MKKLVSIVLALAIICSALFVVGAETETSDKITVTMDGGIMDFDVDSVIENDRVLVPFRAILKHLAVM